jgi:hypothetical protein
MTHVVTPSYCALWANRMTSGVFGDTCRLAATVSLLPFAALQKPSQLKQDLAQRATQDSVCRKNLFAEWID